jgi:hypothetical protein
MSDFFQSIWTESNRGNSNKRQSVSKWCRNDMKFFFFESFLHWKCVSWCFILTSRINQPKAIDVCSSFKDTNCFQKIRLFLHARLHFKNADLEFSNLIILLPHYSCSNFKSDTQRGACVQYYNLSNNKYFWVHSECMERLSFWRMSNAHTKVSRKAKFS